MEMPGRLALGPQVLQFCETSPSGVKHQVPTAGMVSIYPIIKSRNRARSTGDMQMAVIREISEMTLDLNFFSEEKKLKFLLILYEQLLHHCLNRDKGKKSSYSS